MKVILSRKGFDSTNGGVASPILPDGTLLSLPIPAADGKAYFELHYDGQTYDDIIRQLSPKFSGSKCHLDPDIRRGAFNAPAEWKAVFGQNDAALTNIQNQGVGVGDLFLFFGWFKRTERGTSGKLRYVRGEGDGVHIIYGYLQVGAVVTDKAEIAKYHWHPHAHLETTKNCLYITRETLSWDKNRSGYGVFPYDGRLVLTKDGMSRSNWRLPELPIFSGSDRLKISSSRKDAWRNDPQHGEYYRAMDIGQEFVFEETAAVEAWARSLIDGC